MELADTSAWTNKHKSELVLRAFTRGIERGEIVTCDAVKFELLETARHHAEFVALRQELDAMKQVPIRPSTWRRAIDLYEELAAHGPLHHCQVKIPDLLIAAAAEEAGLPVCHYDRDFERIGEVTGQPVRAIAPLGSLE